jgi:uncharacterized protein YajQ (UPF0234 family)
VTSLAKAPEDLNMPSFDIVSEVNMQEVDNAVNQAQKEIAQRYDFKGKKVELDFDKEKKSLRLAADDDSRLDALYDILSSKLFKRGVELGSLSLGKREPAGGMMIRQEITLKQGLETEMAKKIVKLVRDMKIKVDPAIQDQQVRVTAKNIDDLQTVIEMLKREQSQLKIPLQFTNMRR